MNLSNTAVHDVQHRKIRGRGGGGGMSMPLVVRYIIMYIANFFLSLYEDQVQVIWYHQGYIYIIDDSIASIGISTNELSSQYLCQK